MVCASLMSIRHSPSFLRFHISLMMEKEGPYLNPNFSVSSLNSLFGILSMSSIISLIAGPTKLDAETMKDKGIRCILY